MKALKLSLIAATLAAAIQTNAQTPASDFTLSTAKIDAQVIGKSDDGHFFSVTCKSHYGVGFEGLYSYYTANMLFPNSNGDILLEIVKATGDLELSRSIALTGKAAEAVCANPYGRYSFRIVSEKGLRKVDLVAAAVGAAPKQEFPKAGQTYTLRTGLVDRMIAGATSDGRIYAIACARGLVRESTADFIYPNWAGKVIFADYNNFTFGRPGIADLATYMPLTSKAVGAICNHPNGLYTLQVVGSGPGDLSLELISGENYEAFARGAYGRQF